MIGTGGQMQRPAAITAVKLLHNEGESKRAAAAAELLCSKKAVRSG